MDARAAALAGLVVTAGLVCAPGAWGVAGDFDRDGRQDLVVGAPGDNLGELERAGSVQVFYGTRSGPGTDRDKIWTKESPGIAGQAIEEDRFGAALAVGDIDCDRFADLVIGAPATEAAGAAGTVQVIYGGPNGLTKKGDQLAAAPGDATAGDGSGSALAVGDFNGDGCADVAGGEPLAVGQAGRVLVWYGAPSGLAGAPEELVPGSGGIEGNSAAGDFFGFALAPGDLNGDGRHDLAVGAPLKSVGGNAGAGAVNVLYGARSGLSRRGDHRFTQNSEEVVGGATFALGIAEPDDFFGGALTAGDVNGDGTAGLAVAAPGEDIGSAENTGTGHMIYGGPRGLTLEDAQVFNQDALGQPGTTVNPAEFNEDFDFYGAALAIGDVDADGFGDVFASHPGDVAQAGAISLLRGGAGGLVIEGNQALGGPTMFASAGLDEVQNAGVSLATGRFNKGRRVDVAVGANESSGLSGGTRVSVSGAVAVLFGPDLHQDRTFAFDRASPGVAGRLKPLAAFGASLGVSTP